MRGTSFTGDVMLSCPRRYSDVFKLKGPPSTQHPAGQVMLSEDSRLRPVPAAGACIGARPCNVYFQYQLLMYREPRHMHALTPRTQADQKDFYEMSTKSLLPVKWMAVESFSTSQVLALCAHTYPMRTGYIHHHDITSSCTTKSCSSSQSPRMCGLLVWCCGRS